MARTASTSSRLIACCVFALATSAIVIIFGGDIDAVNKIKWEQVTAEHIKVEPLHIVSTETRQEANPHRTFTVLWLNFANATGKIVTSRRTDVDSELHIGSVLPGFHLNGHEYLIPYFDQGVPTWKSALALAIIWSFVALVFYLNIRKRRRPL